MAYREFRKKTQMCTSEYLGKIFPTRARQKFQLLEAKCSKQSAKQSARWLFKENAHLFTDLLDINRIDYFFDFFKDILLYSNSTVRHNLFHLLSAHIEIFIKIINGFLDYDPKNTFFFTLHFSWEEEAV